MSFDKMNQVITNTINHRKKALTKIGKFAAKLTFTDMFDQMFFDVEVTSFLKDIQRLYSNESFIIDIDTKQLTIELCYAIPFGDFTEKTNGIIEEVIPIVKSMFSEYISSENFTIEEARNCRFMWQIYKFSLDKQKIIDEYKKHDPTFLIQEETTKQIYEPVKPYVVPSIKEKINCKNSKGRIELSF